MINTLKKFPLTITWCCASIVYVATTMAQEPAEDVSKVTYQWTDKGIKTSDGRFFPLKKENLVDKDNKPLIVIEARPIQEGDRPSRDKMNVNQVMGDFWYRVQDQDIESLQFVPSKFDNHGDYRLVFTSVSSAEADHLEIPESSRYKVNIPDYNKIIVPIWRVLQKQEDVADVSIPPSLRNRVSELRSKEKPNGQ